LLWLRTKIEIPDIPESEQTPTVKILLNIISQLLQRKLNMRIKEKQSVFNHNRMGRFSKNGWNQRKVLLTTPHFFSGNIYE